MKPADLRRLAAAGLNPEQIAVVMEIMDEDAEVRRANGRARWRKYQDKKKNTNVSQQQQTLAANSRAGVTRVEDKTSNSEIEPQEQHTHSKRETDIAAFRRECAEGGLDSERTEALIKHRRAKRGAITGHAAHLFRNDAKACGMSLIEATDTAISRNWITVKPEYLAGRARAGPMNGTPSLAQVFGMVREKAAEDEQRRDGSGGAGAVVLNLPAVRAQ